MLCIAYILLMPSSNNIFGLVFADTIPGVQVESLVNKSFTESEKYIILNVYN